MFNLKMALTQAPTLVTINYRSNSGLIIITFNASKKGQGAIIMQLDKDNKQYLARFESSIQTTLESRYNTSKREY